MFTTIEHSIPVGDEREHDEKILGWNDFVPILKCACNPSMEVVGPYGILMIVHHPFDDRNRKSKPSWTPERLIELMTIFSVSANMIAKETGIPMTAVYQMRNSVVNFNSHGEVLTAYFESVRDGKIAQLNKMIDFYRQL